MRRVRLAGILRHLTNVINYDTIVTMITEAEQPLTAAEHSALFDVWRAANKRGNSIEDAQDYCDEVNLLILQQRIAQRKAR